jgi:hypothetical protein
MPSGVVEAILVVFIDRGDQLIPPQEGDSGAGSSPPPGVPVTLRPDRSKPARSRGFCFLGVSRLIDLFHHAGQLQDGEFIDLIIDLIIDPLIGTARA